LKFFFFNVFVLLVHGSEFPEWKKSVPNGEKETGTPAVRNCRSFAPDFAVFEAEDWEEGNG